MDRRTVGFWFIISGGILVILFGGLIPTFFFHFVELTAFIQNINIIIITITSIHILLGISILTGAILSLNHVSYANKLVKISGIIALLLACGFLIGPLLSIFGSVLSD